MNTNEGYSTHEDFSSSFEKSELNNANELTREFINESVNKGISAEIKSLSEDELFQKHGTLAELPFIKSSITNELTALNGEDKGIMMVDTDLVVGTVSPAFKNWSTEYSGRKGRAVSVAQELIEGTPDSIEYIFELAEEDKGIKLKQITGPGGSLYITNDGSHRVSGCKLAELDKIPARVEDVSNVREHFTSDDTLETDWRRRIELGLLSGNIETEELSPGVKSHKLIIDEQILPWMTFPQSDLAKFSRYYNEHFEGSLKGLKNLKTGEEIPEDVFTDVIASNYYLAGRYSEYGAGKESFKEPVEGEVAYHQGEWLNEHIDGDISDETKEWLEENGYENVAEGFTVEEQKEADSLKNAIVKKTEKDPGALLVIRELMDGEGDIVEESSEAAKLLLRIAVKLGTKLAVSIAKNISKDKDVPQEIRLMAGVMADGLTDLGKFADKMIAGDAEADLTKDILAFISDKNN